MRKFTTTIPVRALYDVFIIVLILLTASCKPPEIPKIEESPSSISHEQISDSPDSVRKISPGQHLRFDTISLEQGLSQSTVFCMLQDSQGFMWFGTEGGLNKYDGYTFTVYQHDSEEFNNLGSNWIQALFEDDAGTLWVGTREGLDQFNPVTETFTHYRNDPDDPSSLSHDNVTAIYQDQDGFLWIGTSLGGLNRFDPEKDDFIHYQHNSSNPNSLSSNSVSVIYEDKVGVLWIGTFDGGLNRFNREENNWLHYLYDPKKTNSLSHNNVSAISEYKSGVLWIGTDGGGLNKLVLRNVEGLDQEDAQFSHYQHDPNDLGSLSSNDVSTIYHDQDGFLWIGTRSGGVNILNLETETFTSYQNIPGDSYSLSDNWILSIFQDREGVLWFGSIGGGVNKLNLGWRNFTLYSNNSNNPNSLSNNMVRVFHHENDGVLWIGTMFGGANRFDRNTGDWQHYRNEPDDPGSLSNDFVSTMYRDSLGGFWIGTANGLDLFNSETEKFTRYQPNPDGPAGSPENNVRAIYESTEGKFWVGTMGGLYRYDLDDNRWSLFDNFSDDDFHDLSNAWIISFFEDRDGKLWITTASGGLFRIDLETEIVTHYHNDPDDHSSLSSNLTLMGFQDREGSLWFSTLEGLNKFDPETETFKHFREKDGLPDETVYCIVEDGSGNLWVSTNKGLSRFDSLSETFYNYDVTDGLQSNEFNGSACQVSNNGEMFFGGIDGFNTFFPDQIIDNQIIPPVVVTYLSNGGERIKNDQFSGGMTEITLKWPENAFEFEYAALSFAQPEKNQYAYYLEGFEETWNEVGTRRFGGYTNLPGGTYTLRVKGSNNDGVWNENGIAVEITVVPPFWATWWFRGVMLLSLLGVVYGSYRLRIRNLEAREQELESQVEQRTAELIETQETLRQSETEKAITTERSRLARDLHDSVTQSLYSLTLFSEAARYMAEEKGDETIEQYIGQIGTIGLQALKEMRLLVFELRPPELEKEGLVRALRRRLDAVEGRAGVDARVVVDELFILPGIVEQEFFRIAQEALNNSLKHAGAAAVVVYLRRENGRIEMEIVDDGVGFDPESLPDRGGMGLKSIRERAERLGGVVSISSNPGEGTSIKVSIEDYDEAQRQGEMYE